MLKLRDGQLNDSMMFIFLHEFAHVLLEHTNGPITKLLQQELEADRFATTQMSKNWNRWNPISGILVFSFLEALERINSEDEPLNGDAIHPPASKRRHDELDEAIRLAESSGFTEELMGNILEFTHRSHLILSSELLAHGLTPLSPFHSTQSAKMIGVGSSLFRLSEVIERNYPKIVIDIERLPFEASTHDPIPDLAKRRRIPSLDEIVQDVRKRGKEGESARYET